jgi:DnaJ-class molecular chaperone
MKDIALAYGVLSDDTKRRIYDNFGLEGIDRNDLLTKDQSIIPFVHVFAFIQTQLLTFRNFGCVEFLGG